MQLVQLISVFDGEQVASLVAIRQGGREAGTRVQWLMDISNVVDKEADVEAIPEHEIDGVRFVFLDGCIG